MPQIKTREFLVTYTVAGNRGVDARKTVQAVNAATAVKMVKEETDAKLGVEISRVYRLEMIGSTQTIRRNTLKRV